MITPEEKALVDLLFDIPRRSTNNWFRVAALLNPELWIEIVLAGKAPGQLPKK
jgi:hypothetical protein